MDESAKTTLPKGFWLILLIGLISASVATLAYSIKTWRSFSVMQSAKSLGIPEAASIRAWMTAEHLADVYAVSADRLLAALGQPGDAVRTPLVELARAENRDPLEYLVAVQAALKSSGYEPPVASAALAELSATDLVGSAEFLLIAYGLPVLLVTVFLGAFGLPLPSGPAVAVAGAFSASGQYEPVGLFAMLLAAAVAGDLVAYALGALLRGKSVGDDFQIPWINARKWQYASEFMHRWGALGILLTRSLLAQISLLISLLAGLQSFSILVYLLYGVAGRILWLLAYFGLGYMIGADFSVALGFLGYLSLAIIALLTTTGLILMLARLRAATLAVDIC